MMNRLKLKPGDIILILIVTFTIFTLSFNLYGNNRRGKSVVITGEGFKKIYPIESNISVKVKGPLGYTIVVIKNNKAWIKNSPCREKICMKMGKISRPGQQVICVPNRVMVEIEGKNESIDAVSR